MNALESGENASKGTAGADSLSERAYQQIKRQILTYELRPGAILAAPRLAEMYEMSRTPVHEALKRLCQEGFLSVISRVGYVVSSLTLADVQEIFQLRSNLEILGVELAISRIGKPDLERFKLLESKARKSARTISRDDPRFPLHAIDANRDFHVLLASLSGNDRLVELVRGLLDEAQRIVLLDPQLQIDFESMSEEHRAIVDAVAARDRAAAREALATHLQDAQRRVVESLLAEDFQARAALAATVEH